MLLGSLLAVLFVVPLGIFVCHAAVYRAARAAGRKPTAHASALAAIVVWFGVTMAIAIALAWRATGTASSVVCAAVYAGATFAALAVLYMDVVNIAETSLHMHVLLEVTWNDRTSLSSLVERYGAERLIAERLERLAGLGQVREVKGRYYLANRSTLRLNRAIDAWRTVLGLPTSPRGSDVS